MEVDRQIPIIFQELSRFNTNDTRFIKVKIWLMHLQENLNGSYFDKPIVEQAIPTLANTPILAYLECNDDGEKDFSDHRMILVKEEGEFKIKYVGMAIGVIPESCNPQFEKRVCDDGVEREFLTVEGLVWDNKWDDAPDILNRDMIKAQSMELHNDYTGEFGEDGLFHFTSFKFYGACALGKGVQPAMHNASIEVQFSFDKFAQEIQSKMEEFKTLFSNQSSKDVDNIITQEGGNSVNIDELLQKYSLTQEQVTFSLEGLSIEEIETKLQEISKSQTESNFQLSASQFVEELNNVLSTEEYTDRWGDKWRRYSYVDHKDAEVYAYDRADKYKLYGFNFSVSGDKVEIDFASKKRKKFEIVDFEEGDNAIEVNFEAEIEYNLQKQEEKLNATFATEKETAVKEVQTSLEDVQSKFTTLETEVIQFRKEKRDAQETVLFEQYSELDGNEKYEELKNNAAKYTIEDLEKEIALVYAKKHNNFSVKSTVPKTAKIPVDTENETKKEPYGDLFKKYSEQ